MLSRIAKTCLVPIYAAQTFCKPCRFIFLVGHMRCGSSLLSHILCSNPDIAGYGETHRTYRSGKDVDELVYSVLPVLRQLRVSPYILDKIVSDGHICAEMLHRSDCHFIFLAREPQASISSRIRAQRIWANTADISVAEVVQRGVADYCRQLEEIESHASAIGQPSRAVFVTFDEMMSRTNEVLELIADFLHLRVPLQETYNVTRFSGRVGVGDPSEHIRKGHIDRNIKRHDEQIDEKALTNAIELFSSFETRMRLACRSLNAQVTPCHAAKEPY